MGSDRKEIFKDIVLSLLLLSASVIFPLLAVQIPKEAIWLTIGIVVISWVISILAFALFAHLFGVGSIKDWIIFAENLKVLKEETVQKALSDIKKMPPLIRIIEKRAIPDSISMLLDDYDKEYIEKEETKSCWVCGTSLRYTVRNLGPLLFSLNKGIQFQYLCAGDRKEITCRVIKIAKCVYSKNPEWIKQGSIKIRWMESSVPLPTHIYTFKRNDSDVTEILIPFGSGLDRNKKSGCILRDETSVAKSVEKFDLLWRDYQKNEWNLEDLAKET